MTGNNPNLPTDNKKASLANDASHGAATLDMDRSGLSPDESLPIVEAISVPNLIGGSSSSSAEDVDRTYVSSADVKKTKDLPTFERYRVIDKLAAGGMAEIYLAQRIGSRELSVIKQLHDYLSRDAVVGSRFIREAEVAALLNHPNIARLSDAGRDGGCFYLAMEYIPGRDLETLNLKLRDEQRLPPYALTLAVGLRVMDALAYAHEFKNAENAHLEIVHRDLSPRNIMLTYKGEVKVIDFGLARTNLGAFRTAPGVVLGTLRYMSPEQALAEPVDHRSDLYSLAAVMHEMLTGRAITAGNNATEILHAVLAEVPPPPSEVNAQLPKALDAVFAKALSKDRTLRFQSARELAAAFSEAGRTLGIADDSSIGQFTREIFPADYERAIQVAIRASDASHAGDQGEVQWETKALDTQSLSGFSNTGSITSTEGEAAIQTNPGLQTTSPEFLESPFDSTDSGQFMLPSASSSVASDHTPAIIDTNTLFLAVGEPLDPTVPFAPPLKRSGWQMRHIVLALFATALVVALGLTLWARKPSTSSGIPVRPLTLSADQQPPKTQPALAALCHLARLHSDLRQSTRTPGARQRLSLDVRRRSQALLEVSKGHSKAHSGFKDAAPNCNASDTKEKVRSCLRHLARACRLLP